MNYKMIIQFDGGRYRGFQKQTGTKENESTIQGKLESVIRTFTGHEVQLIGCGRTDAGVHSENYTANFHTEIRLDEAELLHHFDMYLPEDIFVKDVSIVSDRFHSRYNAHSKTYQYRISTDRNRNVFTRKYSYHINEMPDMEKMRTMAQEFIGEKDFSGFTNLKSKKKSTVRKVYRIDIHQDKNGEIMIDIEGNGFVQNMARIIAGTILEAGTGKRDTESVRKIFSGGAREDAGAMLPSQGLKLLNVKY